MLPRILKDMATFNDAQSYLGQANAIVLPKLVRKLEEYRGAGMDSAVKIDMGGEPMEVEHTYGGPIRQIFGQYGLMTIAGVGLRFVGAYQNDETGAYDAIEVIVRGRHEEIDPGEAKVGEPGEFKVKSALAYYKLVWNGATVIEIDPINMKLIVDGVDRLAARRAALGV
ncbi:hypothetical protein SAMN06295912_102262 [Sphingomonas laterariae]|uniref:Phage major tail tube protein n=1 Tax=Edaphosphingomonas laterariae TaxID=861865 RepID=A0A239CK54_9SPHN|nr:phage major tail tube protein [Sphingomonas laterariae]SNS20626.1 hypothetical protein SAMN06295912_102262 [Sphingomonas laterariae]